MLSWLLYVWLYVTLFMRRMAYGKLLDQWTWTPKLKNKHPVWMCNRKVKMSKMTASIYRERKLFRQMLIIHWLEIHWHESQMKIKSSWLRSNVVPYSDWHQMKRALLLPTVLWLSLNSKIDYSHTNRSSHTIHWRQTCCQLKKCHCRQHPRISDAYVNLWLGFCVCVNNIF